MPITIIYPNGETEEVTVSCDVELKFYAEEFDYVYSHKEEQS